MTLVYHPAIADISQDVPEENLDAWLAQGWLTELPTLPVEPPRTGTGSGKKAWVAYASDLGLEVADSDTRDDLIAKVDGNGARALPSGMTEPALEVE